MKKPQIPVLQQEHPPPEQPYPPSYHRIRPRFQPSYSPGPGPENRFFPATRFFPPYRSRILRPPGSGRRCRSRTASPCLRRTSPGRTGRTAFLRSSAVPAEPGVIINFLAAFRTIHSNLPLQAFESLFLFYSSFTTGASTEFFCTLAIPFLHLAIVVYPSLTAMICPFFAFRRKRNSPPLSA